MNQTAAAGHPGHEGIIDVASLRDLLGARELRVIDCRHDLTQPDLGREQYRKAHIPGAVFAHLDEDLSGSKTGANGRHPLPDAEHLVMRLRAWGVDSSSLVVAYDASEGAFAARLWWLLRWLGHPRVAVLDGGWPAWVTADGPTTAQEPALPAGTFGRRPALETAADIETVVKWSRSAAPASPNLLLDARAADRYEGRNETLDPVAGHIPGAVNRFWKQNLTADGRFKPRTQLRLEYEALLAGRNPQHVIVQCGSGVIACHDLLAMHLAGLRGAALFAGSWSQWIADPSRPVRRGAAP
ncbi:MAG TPA: sulfurtransferase [Burkholderiaceae bacterium]|nr:sulfurtransferase [Burkholderiaceae bacterium]